MLFCLNVTFIDFIKIMVIALLTFLFLIYNEIMNRIRLLKHEIFNNGRLYTQTASLLKLIWKLYDDVLGLKLDIVHYKYYLFHFYSGNIWNDFLKLQLFPYFIILSKMHISNKNYIMLYSKQIFQILKVRLSQHKIS